MSSVYRIWDMDGDIIGVRNNFDDARMEIEKLHGGIIADKRGTFVSAVPAERLTEEQYGDYIENVMESWLYDECDVIEVHGLTVLEAEQIAEHLYNNGYTYEMCNNVIYVYEDETPYVETILSDLGYSYSVNGNEVNVDDGEDEEEEE